jgi:hypothetical protein
LFSARPALSKSTRKPSPGFLAWPRAAAGDLRSALEGGGAALVDMIDC